MAAWPSSSIIGRVNIVTLHYRPTETVIFGYGRNRNWRRNSTFNFGRNRNQAETNE